MKFLIDENLPPRLAAWLRGRGHTAEHVKELGMLGRSDADIRAAALAGDFVVVTQDADFDGVVSPRVLRLAIGNAPTNVLLARLELLIDDAIQRLEAGAGCVTLS
jgi:predicted nuclease of predicted toxin-antitoxin system